jgi:hypothetical protein
MLHRRVFRALDHFPNRALLSLVIALAALAAPVAARSDDRPFSTPIIQREEVRFITFDLDVEERVSGGWRPARGLVKDQLTLLVGGKRTPLDSFESRCAPPEAASTAGSPRDTTEAARSTEGPGVESAAAPEVVRYILYFDQTHLTFADLRASFKTALNWAATTARPADEAMIVLGGAGLRIARPMLPVSDHLKADIEKAMADFRSNDMWGNQEDARIQ